MFISVRGREDWEPGEAWESHRLVPPHQAHHLVHPGREAEIRRGGNWDQAPGRVAGIRLGVGEIDQALSWEAQNRAASPVHRATPDACFAPRATRWSGSFPAPPSAAPSRSRLDLAG